MQPYELQQALIPLQGLLRSRAGGNLAGRSDSFTCPLPVSLVEHDLIRVPYVTLTLASDAQNAGRRLHEALLCRSGTGHRILMHRFEQLALPSADMSASPSGRSRSREPARYSPGRGSYSRSASRGRSYTPDRGDDQVNNAAHRRHLLAQQQSTSAPLYVARCLSTPSPPRCHCQNSETQHEA